MRRMGIATACGVVAGLVCVSLAALQGMRITPAFFGWALLNRTLLGFVIGISTLRLHWGAHGALLGALVGSIFAYSLWLLGDPGWVVPAVMGGSMVFGLGIEFFTTVVFKQPRALPRAQAGEMPRHAAA